MGRKRSSNRVKLMLTVNKELLEKVKAMGINKSALMDKAMQEVINEEEKKINENNM